MERFAVSAFFVRVVSCILRRAVDDGITNDDLPVAVVRHHGDVGGGMGRGKADIAAGDISIFRFLMSFRVSTLFRFIFFRSFVRSFEVCCFLFRALNMHLPARPQANAQVLTSWAANCTTQDFI